MNKLVYLYLKINYFGQKIGNKFNVENGLVNIILFEVTFLLSGIFLGVLVVLNFIEPLIATLLVCMFVLLIRFLLKSKIRNKIDFKTLEKDYEIASKGIKRKYFVLHILFLFLSLILMIFLVKIVYLLFN